MFYCSTSDKKHHKQLKRGCFCELFGLTMHMVMKSATVKLQLIISREESVDSDRLLKEMLQSVHFGGTAQD